MKTTKIIFSIALVALATVAMGQRTLHLERINPDQDAQIAYLTAHSTNQNEVDIWSHEAYGKPDKKVSWRVFEAPAESKTLFVKQAEIFYEEDIRTEMWMTAPFENSTEQEEQNLEGWMTKPFKIAQAIRVEEWML